MEQPTEAEMLREVAGLLARQKTPLVGRMTAQRQERFLFFRWEREVNCFQGAIRRVAERHCVSEGVLSRIVADQIALEDPYYQGYRSRNDGRSIVIHFNDQRHLRDLTTAAHVGVLSRAALRLEEQDKRLVLAEKVPNEEPPAPPTPGDDNDPIVVPEEERELVPA